MTLFLGVDSVSLGCGVTFISRLVNLFSLYVAFAFVLHGM